MSNLSIDKHPHMKSAEKIRLAIAYIVAILFSIVMVGPFLWGVLTSFLPKANLYDFQISLSMITTENYQRLFGATEVILWFTNTIIVTLGIVVAVVILASLGGYVFATRDFPGKKVLFALILMFLMIPVQVILIPLFLEMRWLGLTDSYLGLILPYSGSAFGVFLLTQYMKTIPPSLISSARIDGANEFRIIFQIMLPLCMPALASLTIIKFNFAWNDFIWPLVVIQSPKMRTLPLGIALLHGKSLSEWGLIMSAVVVSTVPVILLTLFFQRYFVKGVATSGVK